jgi:hypothetical protein
VPVADTAQELALPSLPDSPSRARAFVREALRGWSLDHLADDASVVVSELATNVMLHAGTDFVVGVERSAGGARVVGARHRPLARPAAGVGAPTHRPRCSTTTATSERSSSC